MRNIVSLIFLLTVLLTGCGSATNDTDTSETATSNDDFVQRVDLKIDGNKRSVAQDNIKMTHIDRRLYLDVTNEKENFVLYICIHTDLRPGTYQEYTCIEPSVCDPETKKRSEAEGAGMKATAVYGDYVRDPNKPYHSKMIYNTPSLGLQPLTFVITSVTEKDDGPGIAHKRIQGNFRGVVAQLDKHDSAWIIVGQTTEIEGNFDVICEVIK